MLESAGFVGGDADVVGRVGQGMGVVGDDLDALDRSLGATLRRASAAVGHRAVAAALESSSATWCAGLAAVAAQAAVLALLAGTGADDLRRSDR